MEQNSVKNAFPRIEFAQIAGIAASMIPGVNCKTWKVLQTMIMHMLLNAGSSGILLLIPFLEKQHENGTIIAVIGMGLMLIVPGFMPAQGSSF